MGHDAKRYGLADIRIRLVDVAAEAREMFGDAASLIAGRPLPEVDLRLEVAYGPNDQEREGRITLPSGHRASAEEILRMVNRDA